MFSDFSYFSNGTSTRTGESMSVFVKQCHLHLPPVITIFVGAMFTIPSHGWFMILLPTLVEEKGCDEPLTPATSKELVELQSEMQSFKAAKEADKIIGRGRNWLMASKRMANKKSHDPQML